MTDNAIIKALECHSNDYCGRTVEKRTLKSAVKFWNTRTPKEMVGEENV